MLLFLTTNMAAVTSRANQQYGVGPYMSDPSSHNLAYGTHYKPVIFVILYNANLRVYYTTSISFTLG